MQEHCVEADGGDFSKVNLVPSTAHGCPHQTCSTNVDSVWVFYGVGWHRRGS